MRTGPVPEERPGRATGAAASAMTLALFGGTFDPVHVGHLVLAETVRDALAIHRLLFVPCGQPPHKAAGGVSPGRHRLRMLELALADHPALEPSDLELRGEGASYTIRTIRALKAGGVPRVTLVIGGDSLADLASWREPEAILAESRVVVCGRGGVDLGALAERYRQQITFVDMPRVDVSSSAIRARVRAGRSIRFLVPEPVRAYIERHHLYRD